MSLSLISKYFPELSKVQVTQFSALPGLYQEWNACINVISRKDTDYIEEHHILHSLSIAIYTTLESGMRVFDIGTGGGFPGIPLAILFPSVEFHLIDSIGKKLTVVEDIAKKIGLENVTTHHARAEELRIGKANVVVSRAAMSASMLFQISSSLLGDPNDGIIALKGGDLSDELSHLVNRCTVVDIKDFYPDLPFFQEKKIVHIKTNRRC